MCEACIWCGDGSVSTGGEPAGIAAVQRLADGGRRVPVAAAGVGDEEEQRDRRRCRVPGLNLSGHEASLPRPGGRVVSLAAGLATSVVETGAAQLRRWWQEARLVLPGGARPTCAASDGT